MKKSLEALAKSGCRIAETGVSNSNGTEIIAHDLGSNRYFVGPSFGKQFSFFIPEKPDQKIGEPDSEGALTLVMEQEEGRFEYVLFRNYPSLNMAMRGNVARFVDSAPLCEYLKLLDKA